MDVHDTHTTHTTHTTALIDRSSPGVQSAAIDASYHPAVPAGDPPSEDPSRLGLNGHAAPPDADVARLQAEIDAAKARTAEAKERTRRLELQAKQTMREEVEATRQLIVDLELRQREALSLIEETAEMEIARLRAEHEAAQVIRPAAQDPDADGGTHGG